MAGTFGDKLRWWRSQRRVSQLELALSAGVSARHVSFLETGRSSPSRGMVLRLCEELRIPRAARNELLTAAGLAAAYLERPRSDEELAPLRAAVTWMLDRHVPYPAFAFDRTWCLVEMNSVAERLFGALGIVVGDSLALALATSAAVRSALENRAEIVEHAIHRLRVESAHFGDSRLEAAIAALLDSREGPTRPAHATLPAVVPARYRLGATRLSLFSTIAQFGSAEDVALSELRVELMFPADEASRASLLAMQAAPAAAPAPQGDVAAGEATLR